MQVDLTEVLAALELKESRQIKDRIIMLNHRVKQLEERTDKRFKALEERQMPEKYNEPE